MEIFFVTEKFVEFYSTDEKKESRQSFLLRTQKPNKSKVATHVSVLSFVTEQ
jgi:hypothetical protein